MARKSVKGYSEKNYYDNTKFTGGVVATHDTLNEGSFKHLVNFDISDMGQSLSPRKGFITTTLKYKDEVIPLSDSTIYFFDANIGKYIFIDFKKGSRNQAMRYIPCIYKATLDLNAEYITNVEKIDNLDTSELLPYLRSKDIYNAVPEYGYMLELAPVDNNIAQSIIDEYGITKYIIKVTTRNIQFWMSIVYREKETKYENVTYPANTVVLSYLNFDDTVNINTADRNIASGSSIIPNPIQVFYDEANEPPGFVETFPLIYVKQNDDYLLQTTQKLDGLEFIPHFALKEITDENYTWAYTYDIISTSLDSQYFDEEVVHRATLYDLKTNEILINAPISHAFSEEYFEAVDTIYEKYDIPVELFDSSNNDFYYRWDSSKYISYVSDLNITTNKFFKDIAKDTLIVYACPKTFDQVDPVLFEGYYNVNDLSMVHLIPILSNIYISGEDTTASAREYNDLVAQTSIFNSSNYYIKTVDKFRYAHAHGLPNSVERVIELLSTLNDVNNYQFYIKGYDELSDYFDEGFKGYSNYVQTALQSRIIAFKEEGMSFDELTKILRSREYTNIILKPFTTVSIFDFRTTMVTGNKFPNNTALCKLFYDLNTSVSKYYVYTDLDKYVDDFYDVEYSTIISDYRQNLPFENAFNTLFKYIYSGGETTLLMPMITRAYKDVLPSYYNPCTFIKVRSAIKYYGESIFKYTDKTLSFTYDNTLDIIRSLSNLDYFTQGVSINFYITKIPKKEYVDATPSLKDVISYTRDYFITTTPYVQLRQVILSSVKPTTIIQQLEAEPADIATAKESLIFRSSLGDCLVLYIGNKVYMSEPSYQYYFKYTGVYEYPEPIIKVIQYKDTLLVFTTQNLYSIYPTEITNSVENGTDEEGNTKYVQVTTTVYATLPVLYNLMVDSRYKDAIQVYNQMVLFYSADGQMFMIKPAATIDSDTRFSIQYFNKSVNDILLNYKEYMQERLESYGTEGVIEDVNIKVSVSINFIKIFYSAPGLMTYILIYDIINNRYYIYDTLDFTNVRDFWYNDGFEVYVSKRDNFMYFTQQLNEYADTSQYYNFTQHGIETELDTGTINLNNHLKKRFKDIHVMYKNITADTLKFSVDTYVDDVPVYIDIQSSIEVRSVASKDTYVVVDSDNKVNLLEENTALFDFSKYNSNRILTHRTNIVSRGKTFRTQFHFNSTGLYKIMGYGIIYKEHTV